jgi:hypothetical protein
VSNKLKLYVITGFLGGFGAGRIFWKKRDEIKRLRSLAQVEFQTAVKMKEMFAQGCSDEEVARFYREHLVFLEAAVNH